MVDFQNRYMMGTRDLLKIKIAMAGIFFVLLPALQASNGGFEKKIDWLKSMTRVVTCADRNGILVQSYGLIPDRCWIYDQALAVIAFTATGDADSASRILSILERLQNEDGSFYFSYLISTLSPPDGGKRIYSGTVAWVAMAVNFYYSLTSDNRFFSLLYKTLCWLEKQQELERGSPAFGGITFGMRRDILSTEHNLDCYSAFRHAGISRFKSRAKLIKKFMLRHLYRLQPAPHFITGLHDGSLYLDCQSWAPLALGGKYRQVLEFALDRFKVSDGRLHGKTGIQGFFERVATEAPVWSEGSLGMALALYLNGEKEKGDFYFKQVEEIVTPEGGVCYATDNDLDFSTSPSVAGTAWSIFYEMKLNPFEPGRKSKRNIKRFMMRRREAVAVFLERPR